MSATARRLRWWTIALTAVLLIGACSDDTPSEDAPSPATGDGGVGVGAGDATLVDPVVPLSNVPNEPQSPLDPGGDPASSWTPDTDPATRISDTKPHRERVEGRRSRSHTGIQRRSTDEVVIWRLKVHEICVLTWENDGCDTGRSVQVKEALSVTSVPHLLDRVEAIVDDDTLVADAGLIVPATLMVRLGFEVLVNQTLRLVPLWRINAQAGDHVSPQRAGRSWAIAMRIGGRSAGYT
jgi:hypothetical protein